MQVPALAIILLFQGVATGPIAEFVTAPGFQQYGCTIGESLFAVVVATYQATSDGSRLDLDFVGTNDPDACQDTMHYDFAFSYDVRDVGYVEIHQPFQCDQRTSITLIPDVEITDTLYLHVRQTTESWCGAPAQEWEFDARALPIG